MLALGVHLFKFPTWSFLSEGFNCWLIFSLLLLFMVNFQQYCWPLCGKFVTCNICGFSQFLLAVLLVNLVLLLQFKL